MKNAARTKSARLGDSMLLPLGVDAHTPNDPAANAPGAAARMEALTVTMSAVLSVLRAGHFVVSLFWP